MGESTAEALANLSGVEQAVRLEEIKKDLTALGQLQTSNKDWSKTDAAELASLQEEKNRILMLPLTTEEQKALARQLHAGEGHEPELTDTERILISLANVKTDYQKEKSVGNKSIRRF